MKLTTTTIIDYDGYDVIQITDISSAKIVKVNLSFYKTIKEVKDEKSSKIISPERKCIVLNNYCVILWKNENYEKIGDWTQKQSEDRISELLGIN